MDLETILANARTALGKGAPVILVDARVREKAAAIGTQVESLEALQTLLGRSQISRTPIPQPGDRKAEALARLNAGGGNAVGDFLSLLAAGGSLGFADEVIGLVSPEKGEALRQRVEDLRTLAPKTAFITEAAGGLVTGLAGAAGIGSRLAARGASRLVSRGVGGLLSGLGVGAAVGAGEAEGGLAERAGGAMRGGLIGGLLGGGFGITSVLPAAVGSRAGRILPDVITSRLPVTGPKQLIATLRKGTGVGVGIREFRELGENALQVAKKRFFGPLDKEFKQVDDPLITEFMARLRKDPDGKEVLRGVSRRLVGKDRILPSFRNLQDIRDGLFRNNALRSRGDQLKVLIRERIPGALEADTAFRQFSEVVENFPKGRKLWNKPAGDIDFELLQFQDNPGAQEAIREGMVVELIERLGQREKKATAVFKRIADAGDEFQDTIRRAFPGGGDDAIVAAEQRKGAESFEKFLQRRSQGDRDFQNFMRDVRDADSAEAITRSFRKWGGRAAALLAIGTTAFVAGRLGAGSQGSEFRISGGRQ